MTPYADYLAMEEASGTKHEYVHGQVFAMAGGTPEHSRLAAALIREFGAALRGKPCNVFTSDARVRVESTNRSTYPDVTVVCGKVAPASDDPHAITNPVVIVEVLSDETEADDRGDKFAHYRRLPSLREYILVSERARRIETYRRDGARWILTEASDGEHIRLESLDVAVAVTDVYNDPAAPSAS